MILAMTGKLNFTGTLKLIAEGMVFEPDNRVFCGQDFRLFRSLPDGIRFSVYESDIGYILRGPGYGDPNDYGNGPLYVSRDDIESFEPLSVPQMTTDSSTCSHCWHDTGYIMLTFPPQIERVCCHCGTKQLFRPENSAPVGTHGPYMP